VRKRLPSTATLLGLALCALILGFAAADLIHTESRLPDVSPACPKNDAACRKRPAQ
jgi:hypothetical protein